LLWDVSYGKDATSTLYYLTVSGKNFILLPKLDIEEKIAFNFFISKTLGTVEFGTVRAVVTPKSLESVISISGWKYKDIKNHLELVFGSCAGALAVGGTATSTSNVLTSGSGDDQVYVYYAEDAQINGKRGLVTVSHESVTDFKTIVDDVETQLKLTTAFKGVVAAKLTKVAFDAGASNIIYDPGMGNGPVPQVDSGASLIISLVILFVTLMF